MLNVTKANKTIEPFNEEKVLVSIRRAGIPSPLHDKVLRHIKGKLYDRISTKEIYNHIIEFLGESEHPYFRSRYSLKEGIMALGPTGYPFEDFVSKLLEEEGYQTKVRQVLQGDCITHEIDVIAQKDAKSIMVEVKYHNSPGTPSQIHVALYTQARFEDVRTRNHLTEAWIVTNTKTTSDVNTYSLCKNITVMSWSYPVGGSLRDLVEKKNLHPVTLLTTLNQSQKVTLLDNHILLCKEIHAKPELLDLLFVSQDEKERILEEIAFICSKQ